MAVDLSNMSRAIYNNYASHIGPEDVVIIFSAPGYAKYIVNTARYLAKKIRSPDRRHRPAYGAGGGLRDDGPVLRQPRSVLL